MAGRDILDHGGEISRDEALEKAHREYAAYKAAALQSPSVAECHFLEQAEQELKILEKRRNDRQAQPPCE
jgi:hypothetical protein